MELVIDAAGDAMQGVGVGAVSPRSPPHAGAWGAATNLSWDNALTDMSEEDVHAAFCVAMPAATAVMATAREDFDAFATPLPVAIEGLVTVPSVLMCPPGEEVSAAQAVAAPLVLGGGKRKKRALHRPPQRLDGHPSGVPS